MVSSTISKRNEVIQFWQQLDQATRTYTRVAKKCRVSITMAKKWILQYTKEDHLEEKPRLGQPTKITKKLQQKVLSLAKQNNYKTSRSIHREIGSSASHVSCKTITRILHQGGYEYKPLKKIPLLKEDHLVKRVEYAYKHINQDWSQVIFSDESTFLLMDLPNKAWMKPEYPKIGVKLKHPPKVHVWGCFSIYGFGELVLFEENLNADLMKFIYKKGLLGTIKKQFGGDPGSIKLLEDNDPKHKSKTCVDWKKENNIECIPFPACSPDLNPIENIWGIMKRNRIII